MAHVEDEEVPVQVLDTSPVLSKDDGDLLLEMTYIQCLAAGSYVIGHGGQAVVIDPMRDVTRYLKVLDDNNLKLKAVLLSHAHADFVSGHRELADRAGGVVVYGAQENLSHGFGVMNGDVLALSDKYHIRVMTTPGHTPGSVTYVLTRADGDARKDIMAFTGDTLFVGSCGRPDLVASKGFSKEQMASYQFTSLQKLATLPDDVYVFPAHGAGSPCGKSLSDKLYSTIGDEKKTNPALQFNAEAAFVEWLISSTGTLGIPQYFLNCVTQNIAGAQNLDSELLTVPRLSPEEFAAAHKSHTQRWLSKGNGTKQNEGSVQHALVVMDTREPAEFYRSHVAGSVSLPLGTHGGEILSAVEGNFAIWVGTLIPVDAPILLVTPKGRRREALVRLGRIGYTKHVHGMLDGTVEALQDKLELASAERCVLRSMDQIRASSAIFLDARGEGEFACTKNGRVQNAINVPLGGSVEEYVKLASTLGLSSDVKYLVYCSGGYRSTIAASILRSAGLNVVDIYGGYDLSIKHKFREITTLTA